MTPRVFPRLRRSQLASWSPWACLSGVLAVAWVGFSAWAEGPRRDWPADADSRSAPRTLVQLGFVVADDVVPPPRQNQPPLPLSEVSPAAPLIPLPRAYPQPLPAVSALPRPQNVPQPAQGAIDDDLVSERSLRDPWWSVFVTA